MRDSALGVLAFALLPACAGGVAADGGSPFGSGGDGPLADPTSDTGDADDTSEGGDESSGDDSTDPAAGEADADVSEGSGSSGDGSTSGASHCLPSTDDCDGDGLCEANLSAAETCGACDKSCVLPSTTLACNAGTCEGVVSITAIADAYIDDDDDSTNFGSAAYLVVVDDADIDIALVKPSDLGGIPIGATVTNAELVLTCTTVGSPLTIVELTSAWDEQTVTWNDRPSQGTELTTHAPVAGPNAIPITALAQTWIAAGLAHGVQLATTGENDNLFPSRESTTASDHPRFDLSVSY